MRILVLFIFGNLWFCSAEVFGQLPKTIVLTPEQPVFEDSRKLFFLEDSLAMYSFSAIQQGKYDAYFRQGNAKTTTFHIPHSAVWGRFKFQNRTGQSVILELNEPTLDSVRFYAVYPDRTEEIRTGDHLKYDTRSLKVNTFQFLLPAQATEFYFRVFLSNPTQLPIKIATAEYFIQNNHRKDLFQGFFIGSATIILIYHLFVFWSTRLKLYWIYSLYLLGSTIGLAQLNNYNFEFLWASVPQINHYNGVIYALSMIPTPIFSIYFLNIKQNSRSMYLIFIGFVIWSCLTILVGLSGFDVQTLNLNNLNILVSSFYSLAVGIILAVRGVREAKFYLLARTMIILGIVLAVVKSYGYLPNQLFFNNILQISMLMEMLFMAFAVSDKINTLRKDKDQAQQEALASSKENTRLIEAQNEMLEHKVTERTLEIQSQNEELQQQTEEILAQKEFIESQHAQLSDLHQSVTSSIRYAETIQHAMLPATDKLEANFDQVFILYKPKDVVSGDFYYFTESKKRKFIAVSDCTGHGVPGAFMSMLGVSLLHQIIGQEKIHQPDEILDTLHLKIEEVLRQQQSDNRDGMDIGICVIEDAGSLKYSSAKRPFYYFTENEEFITILGSRRSVGGRMLRNKPFHVFEKKYQKGDIFYMTTDGYIDQCNEKRQNYGSIRLENDFKNMVNLPLHEQKIRLDKNLTEFQATAKQRDDITILGLKF